MLDIPAPIPHCRLLQPGCVPYQQAWNWQRELVAQRSAGLCDDTLLLLQHPPTITLGRAAKPGHLLLPPDELARRGVAVVPCDRGGEVTYHAPGQLVGYPILKLRQHGGDVLAYLRRLEELLVRVLSIYGLIGRRIPGLTGVWVDDAKIAAIGVRLSASGVTSHGFALNVSLDLVGFSQIVPCGIADCSVTSLAALLGTAPPLEDVAKHVAAAFAELFAVQLEQVDLAAPIDEHDLSPIASTYCRVL